MDVYTPPGTSSTIRSKSQVGLNKSIIQSRMSPKLNNVYDNINQTNNDENIFIQKNEDIRQPIHKTPC